MSTPNYYQSGNHFSRTLKDTMKRVRQLKPARYVTTKVTEQRVGSDGTTQSVQVIREPDATPLTPKQRHNLAHGRRY